MSLALAIAMIVPPAGAAATGQARAATRRSAGGKAIVPVLAESGGAALKERQRGARVRIFALRGSGDGRRLVGRGRTGSQGVALVRLSQRRAPARMLVVVGGGRLLGRRFGGHMKARIAYRGHHAVFVSPVSSLVAQFMAEHPHRSLSSARRTVRRSLRIPGFFDFAGDLADRSLFDGRSFVRQARGQGGFDRFLRRRTRRLGHPDAHSSAVVSEGCWREASQTTAGFAQLMGFSGVPSPPALPSCRLAGTASASALAVAHASGVPGLEVFGVLTSVASLIYGVTSGKSTAVQLEQIQAQLNEVQAELQDIQAELGSLQDAVGEVKAGEISGNESALIADAVPTINRIKEDGNDTMALVAAIDQVLCEPGEGCSKPEGSKNLGQALKKACKKNKSQECDTYERQLDLTIRALEGAAPLEAIEDIGAWADGSAFSGVNDPAIVQYSLEQGAENEQFFETSNASDARLQWAYYTLYSAYAQLSYATVLSLGIGQLPPHSNAPKPKKISAKTVRKDVDRLNKPIGLQLTVFPNMPDSAVIDTNAEAGESPYMFPRQIGALASARVYELNEEYELSQSNVASGSITSPDSDAYLTTLQKSGEPPLVMTPAAASGETWELLPSGGERSRPPEVNTATFSDWSTAGAEDPGGGLPEWTSSTQKVEPKANPLTGPLPDLYSDAKPAAGETRGQWMTSHSGIESGLLTPESTGYGSVAGGVVPYFDKSGTDSKEPGLGFLSCVPGGDEECLLPTWQSIPVDPYSQVSSGQTYNSTSEQINTGLFDFNNGVVIANQQGHKKDESRGFYEELSSNPGAFLNQYPNWSDATEIRGEYFGGFLESLDGVHSNSLQNASFSSKGRPVLFDREQAPNDCFYWTSSGSGPAYGSGCLKKREHSGEILPGPAN